MDFDLDLFEDTLPDPSAINARAGGKFQPRVKQRQPKAIASFFLSNVEEKAVSRPPTCLDSTKSVEAADVLEEDSSGFNLDLVACVVPETDSTNGRACDKFQAKPIPRTETSELVLPDSANYHSITVLPTVCGTAEFVRPVYVLKDSLSLSLSTSVDVGAKEPRKDNEGLFSHEKRSLESTNLSPASRESIGLVGPVNSEAAVPTGNSDQNFSLVKSAGKAGSLGFDLDLMNDILPEPYTSTSRAGGKYQSKTKLQPQKESSVQVSSSPDCKKDRHAAIAFGDCQMTQSAESADILNSTFDQVVLDPSLSDLGSIEKVTREDVNSKDAQPAELNCTNNSGRDFRFVESALEVDCSGFDLDPFSDGVPEHSRSKVRAGGNFQPRTKAQPRKETFKAVAFDVSDNTVEKVASLASTVSDKKQSGKSVNVRDGSPTDPVCSSITTFESFGSKEPAQNNESSCSTVPLCDNRSSGFVNSSEFVASHAQHSGVAVCDLHSRLGIGENADIFSGLACIHDYVTHSTSSTEIPASASNEKDPEDKFNFPAEIFVNSSESRSCDVETLGSVTHNKIAVQIDNGISKLEFGESRAFRDMETPDPLSEATIASDAVESVLPPLYVEFSPSETVNINEGSFPVLASDDACDYSSMSFVGFIHPDCSTTQLPLDEEQMDIARTSCSDNVNIEHPEDVPGMPEKEGSKSRKRKSSSASNLSRRSKQSSLAGEMNEGGKSTRQLRKRAAASQLVDEAEDGHDACGFPAESPNSSVVGEENNDSEYRVDEDSDDEYRAKSTSGKKRASKMSKKPVAEKEKTVRKHQRANDAPEQSTHEPPKKFSHSTRQNKRRVNKNLLNMPEEEIDFKRLSLRDVILFAEYKERLAIKEAKASKNPVTNQSTENSIHGAESHNEDTVASEQDKDYDDDDQRNARPQSNPSLFNHQSFMDKTPATRWSKQDTELFYEGIRQFGTDLSMIQQLFPGRTRRQVKSKLKKEERQHPLRLTEALNNRPEDHSYFEKVIEQLQEVAAKAEQESNRDDSLSMIDEEDVLNAETNEEVEQFELDKDIAVKDQEADVAGDYDSRRYGESDDYLDIWSSYKSEF